MNLLDPHTYFFELPLYSKVKFDKETDRDAIVNLIHGDVRINAYNPSLKENTTYTIDQPFRKSYILDSYYGLIAARLICTRTQEDLFVISWLDEDEATIQKIGQYPSIAYYHISKIKDYQKVIDRDKMKELTRAIGLAANGVGIGSFVYLRRISSTYLKKNMRKPKRITSGMKLSTAKVK